MNGPNNPRQYDNADKDQIKDSIAVLPFLNSSSEKELDYICDGIAEEVIDRLTRAEELLVTARSSSFFFKKRDISFLEISKKLNVSYVLDGSIRRRGDEYKISYQLVDAVSGYNVLSNTLLLSFDKLYDSEVQISNDILAHFNIIESSKKNTDTVDYYIEPKAYSYYLKGKQLAYLWTEEASTEAIASYQKALEIIPNYALAYAGISICYTHSAVNGFGENDVSFEKALLYADKAINSDKEKHEGYLAKALVSFWADDWNLGQFEDNLHKALLISPSNAEIRMFNGMLFLFKGDFRRAMIEIKLAKDIDPLSIPVIIRLGLIQYLNKDYENAYNTFLPTLKIPSLSTYSCLRLAWCCINLGQYEKALAHLDEAIQPHTFLNMNLSAYLVVHHLLKNEKEFSYYKEKIESMSKEDPTYNYNNAVLYKVLKKPERSLYYLDKTLEIKVMRFAFIQYDEFWDEYANMPAFLDIVNKNYYRPDKKLITLESDTRETLKLAVQDFLYAEAQDNYTSICSYKEGKIGKKIIRASLSNVEQQLPQAEIIRCHRSYLINVNAGFHCFKSNNKCQLKHPELDIYIPVSRSKEKEVRLILCE